VRLATFNLEIVSVEESIFNGEVNRLFAIGSQGNLEILAGHAPLLTELLPGAIWYADKFAKETAVVILGGFLEVQPKKTILLADAAVRASEIDVAMATKAKAQAQEMLAAKKGEIDFGKINAELAMAVAQLQLIKKLRKGK